MAVTVVILTTHIIVTVVIILPHTALAARILNTINCTHNCPYLPEHWMLT